MKRENVHSSRMTSLPARAVLPLVLLIYTTFARGLYAQTPDAPEIAIAPKPVGSGARALGQSAFIAVADDATAASWNPAGLINLEKPEASLVGAWKATTYNYSAADPAISIERDTWDRGEINFMSYAHPLSLGNTDAVISVNYHQVYDFGLEFSYTFLEDEDELGVSGASEGALSAYSVAAGLSMPSRPEVTIGASFNWYTNSLVNDYTWRETRTTSLEAHILDVTETFDDFDGYNFTFGLLWDAYESEEKLLTLGIVCHTPFTAAVRRELSEVETGFPTPLRPPPEHWEMDFPLSFGVGVNYRFSDPFSAAIDVEWKQWSQFEQRDPNGTVSSPIGDGKGDIADTTAFRLGFEYLPLRKDVSRSVLAYRGGAFYEPRPALDEAMPVYGFSLGLGWTVKERFSLDFAYQFRWAEEVGGRNLGTGLENIDYRMQEHFLVTSLITYF